MNKTEYVARMLNERTKGKRFENYVVNAIYAKINDERLIPVTQQYVMNPNDNRRYYLLDLYFPQLNYGIEVDEGHHLNEENKINDAIRAEDILSAIQCSEGRIPIYNENNSLRNLSEINKSINEEVQKIKKLIKQKGPLKWLSDEDKRKQIKEKKILSISDDIEFRSFKDVLALFGLEPVPRRCSKNIPDSSIKIWAPHLSVEMEDGSFRDNNGWQNFLNEERTQITEIDKKARRIVNTENWDDRGFTRIVFMWLRDRFGKKCLKFIGVFKAKEASFKNDSLIYKYERCGTDCKIN